MPGGDRITLRQLLGHTAGLWDYTDSLGDYPDLLRDRDKQWRPEDLLALATSHEPLFEPDTSQAYSNTGYLLLGMVLRSATGHSYQEELSRRITGPLRLEHTAMPADSTLPGPHAHGYVEIDGALADFTRLTPSWASSAGGLVSTATELNKFFAALFAGRLLRPAEQRELFLPVGAADFYGLGVYRVDLSCGQSAWGARRFDPRLRDLGVRDPRRPPAVDPVVHHGPGRFRGGGDRRPGQGLLPELTQAPEGRTDPACPGPNRSGAPRAELTRGTLARPRTHRRSPLGPGAAKSEESALSRPRNR
ncbi:serine hydrolase domain-containing protein [Longispora urticae]